MPIIIPARITPPTIAIIGVISVIAVLSYNSINVAVKEREKENVVTKIKVAAQRYCEEKNIEQVFVQTLIDEGKISSENGYIYNPENKNENYNCYYYDKEKGELTVNDNCSLEISDGKVKINYCISGTCKELDNSEWITTNKASLTVISDKLDLKNASYVWINPLAPDKSFKTKEMERC